MDARSVLFGSIAGLIAVYAGLLLGLWDYARRHPETVSMREALRLLPGLLRLIGRPAAEKSVPRGVRMKRGLVLAYLLMPIDPIPDFLPGTGYPDDVIILAVVLRSVLCPPALDLCAVTGLELRLDWMSSNGWQAFRMPVQGHRAARRQHAERACGPGIPSDRPRTWGSAVTGVFHLDQPVFPAIDPRIGGS